MLDALINEGGVKLVLLAACGLVGGLLALNRSTYLVDFFMVVACTNRFVRRLLDWTEGAYDPQPLTSLAAPLIAVCATGSVVIYFNESDQVLKRTASLLGGAVIYGFVLGFGQPRAAIFGLLMYATSFGMLVYAALSDPDRATVLRWMRLLCLLGIAVAIYGVFQWATIPPWDAFWLEASGMNTMGKPIPYEMAVFSTLESRGPFGFFMAIAAVPLICLPECRGYFGWPGIAVIILGALLSMARINWGFIVLGVLFYLAMSGGQSFFRVSIVVLMVACLALYALPMLPNSEKVSDRVETLGELSEDGSFQGRINIAEQGTWKVLQRPWGFGLGGTGVGAGKLADGGVVGDNGYLMMLAEFGLPGCIAIAIAFMQLVKSMWYQASRHGSEFIFLGISLFLCLVVTQVINNRFTGPYAGMVFIIMSGAWAAECGATNDADEHELMEIGGAT